MEKETFFYTKRAFKKAMRDLNAKKESAGVSYFNGTTDGFYDENFNKYALISKKEFYKCPLHEKGEVYMPKRKKNK